MLHCIQTYLPTYVIIRARMHNPAYLRASSPACLPTSVNTSYLPTYLRNDYSPADLHTYYATHVRSFKPLTCCQQDSFLSRRSRSITTPLKHPKTQYFSSQPLECPGLRTFRICSAKTKETEQAQILPKRKRSRSLLALRELSSTGGETSLQHPAGENTGALHGSSTACFGPG